MLPFGVRIRKYSSSSEKERLCLILNLKNTSHWKKIIIYIVINVKIVYTIFKCIFITNIK